MIDILLSALGTVPEEYLPLVMIVASAFLYSFMLKLFEFILDLFGIVK